MGKAPLPHSTSPSASTSESPAGQNNLDELNGYGDMQGRNLTRPLHDNPGMGVFDARPAPASLTCTSILMAFFLGASLSSLFILDVNSVEKGVTLPYYMYLCFVALLHVIYIIGVSLGRVGKSYRLVVTGAFIGVLIVGVIYMLSNVFTPLPDNLLIAKYSMVGLPAASTFLIAYFQAFRGIDMSSYLSSILVSSQFPFLLQAISIHEHWWLHLIFGLALLLLFLLPNEEIHVAVGQSIDHEEFDQIPYLHRCCSGSRIAAFARTWRGKNMSVIVSCLVSIGSVAFQLQSSTRTTTKTTPTIAAFSSFVMVTCVVVSCCCCYFLLVDMSYMSYMVAARLKMDRRLRCAIFGKAFAFYLKVNLIRARFVTRVFQEDDCRAIDGTFYPDSYPNSQDPATDGTCVLNISWERLGEVSGLVFASFVTLVTLASIAIGDVRAAVSGDLRRSAQGPKSVALGYRVLVVSVSASSLISILAAVSSQESQMSYLLMTFPLADALTKCCLNEGARHFDACRIERRFTAMPSICSFRHHILASSAASAHALLTLYSLDYVYSFEEHHQPAWYGRAQVAIRLCMCSASLTLLWGTRPPGMSTSIGGTMTTLLCGVIFIACCFLLVIALRPLLRYGPAPLLWS